MHFFVEWFESLGSTNLYMREKLRESGSLRSGTVFVAREQTEGRGRLNRSWNSAPGKDLCCSFFWGTDAPPEKIPSISMAVALGVNSFLRELGLESSPKWPNDVLVGRRKICGILSQSIPEEGVIVGIGLNVNMSSAQAAEIDQPASSILIETGVEHEIGLVLDGLLNNISPQIERWELEGFLGLRDEWMRCCGGIGKNIFVRDGDARRAGTLAGFGDHGELVLRTEKGALENIWAADMETPEDD